AVYERLRSPEPHRHARGTRFDIGTLPGGRGRVVLGLTGKGNQSSAVLAERAIQEFAPTALFFVGVAGALWATPPLGDVVVATHVYAYHGGTSEDDGLKARPRAWEAPHEIGQTAAHLARVGTWAHHCPPDQPRPQTHLGAIAAGEIVQNSRVSRGRMDPSDLQRRDGHRDGRCRRRPGRTPEWLAGGDRARHQRPGRRHQGHRG